jgi:PII-like signaling protein
MQGYQVAFFTQQDRRHGGKPLSEWLLEQARALGIGGATAMVGSEGFGHHRRFHSWRFFELAEQPVEITMAVTAEEAERLFALLRREAVQVFYVKSAVEFGTLGGAS